MRPVKLTFARRELLPVRRKGGGIVYEWGLKHFDKVMPQPLRNPEDVRQVRERYPDKFDDHPTLTVETDAEAEEYGRAFIEAFNEGKFDAEPGRTFVSCVLLPEGA